MNSKLTRQLFSFLFLFISVPYFSAQTKVYTTYLWHMDQPVYWPDFSKDKPESKQFAEESQRLKANGTNMYAGSSVAHPTNNLEEIFGKADRILDYQTYPRDGVSSIKDLTNAGAQVSISGGLMDNVKSLGDKNQWGFYPTWYSGYKEAYNWKTSGGFPRLDIINFTYDHALSPLVSERTLIKEIQAHQYSANKYYGSSSKGYWPAECAFSEHIIKALKTCGIEWSVVPNSHLARTLSDYIHPYNINGNIDAPNKADIVSAVGTNWADGTIDGRGVRIAAPYSYQAHKAQYIDPNNGTAYTIDVVPMCNYMSYVDGYSGENAGDVSTRVAAYSDASHPSIVLLAHDGDNAWGGGSSYYGSAVTSFSHGASSAGYQPTTIQQFLKDNPVPANDIVHVEDGAWVNAADDWGHPQFINWLWPLYSKTNYRFDPTGWTEDAYNWSVLTAAENYVTMAEDLEGGNLRIQYVTEGGTMATNAEKAWHFYMGGLNSGFMYYGTSEDMIVKESLAGNNAIDYANKVISSKIGIDNTPPSVFIPQRFPYNPGDNIFGALSGYKKVAVSSDFDVWTYAYDVSGLASVTLKYRTDFDGKVSADNKIYSGGSGVTTWFSKEMTRQPMAAAPSSLTASIFITPKAKADLCYAEIKGLKDTLVDYYVEAVDTKGNVYKSPIQHVYVGASNGGGGTSTDVNWTPTTPTTTNTITITSKVATAASYLHWGINANGSAWTIPNAVYQPAGTVAVTGAVETPFTLVNGVWQVILGPFNNPAQAVSSINFVLKHGSTWDNNGGSNYQITVTPVSTNNPLGQNVSKTLNAGQSYTFAVSDFGFSSPVSNTFKGIKVLTVPTAGSLVLNNSPVTTNQIITSLSQLIYTAGSSTGTFTFQIIDSADLLSDAIYTATFTVGTVIPTGITVSFKKPTDWGTTGASVYAWTGTSTAVTGSWPGTAMTDIGNGWYSYTFASTISTVNVIFSKAGSPQTVDITGVTLSTCYQTSGLSGSKLTVSTTTCPTSAVETPQALLKALVYPQPATNTFIVEIPNIDEQEKFNMKILDLSGNEVRSESFRGNTATFERANLKQGLYIVHITGIRSGSVFSSKLLIK